MSATHWKSKKKALADASTMPGRVNLWRANMFPDEKSHTCYLFMALPAGETPEPIGSLVPGSAAPTMAIVQVLGQESASRMGSVL